MTTSNSEKSIPNTPPSYPRRSAAAIRREPESHGYYGCVTQLLAASASLLNESADER